jgi:hypothetical protein
MCAASQRRLQLKCVRAGFGCSRNANPVLAYGLHGVRAKQCAPHDEREGAMSTKVTVYHFTCEIPGHIVAPKYMAGTLEAIAALINCTPIIASARVVDAKLLEHGFYFEHVPCNFVPIEDPRFDSRSAAQRFAAAACGAAE